MKDNPQKIIAFLAQVEVSVNMIVMQLKALQQMTKELREELILSAVKEAK